MVQNIWLWGVGVGERKEWVQETALFLLNPVVFLTFKRYSFVTLIKLKLK